MRRTLFFSAFGVVAMSTTRAFADQGQTIPVEATPSLAQVGIAVVTIVVGTVLIRLVTNNTTLLRDDLLLQIAPSRQPYSLGRWQMAFWFVLVFLSFTGIYLFTGNYHTITPQALWLMGISATTGLAAIAVDVIKDSPADAVNRGLEALGLATYEDVEKVEREIEERKGQLAKPGANAQQLALEIRDGELLLATYEDRIKPFVSEGWYKDITTDLNGTALHRLQTLAWTLLLGVVFVANVLANRIMPQFDSALLILLGISSAGYVGFKYPERQQ